MPHHHERDWELIDDRTELSTQNNNNGSLRGNDVFNLARGLYTLAVRPALTTQLGSFQQLPTYLPIPSLTALSPSIGSFVRSSYH